MTRTIDQDAALAALTEGRALLVCAHDEQDPDHAERARRSLVAGAIPLHELIARKDELVRDQSIIFYCASADGVVARSRAREWGEAGFREVRVLEGGLDGWNAEAGGGRKRLARDVMTPNPAVVDAKDTVCVAAFKMREGGVGALPVQASGHLLGMITDRDITIRVTAEGKSPDLTTVAEAMTHDFVCCAEGDDLQAVGLLMQKHRIRRIPVMKSSGAHGVDDLVGIISLGDLATDLEASPLPGETLTAVSEPTLP